MDLNSTRATATFYDCIVLNARKAKNVSIFRNQVAAITGAGSGIGRSLAEALATEGCNLAISDINATALQETADLIAAQVGDAVKVTQHPLDVSDEVAVEAFAKDAAASHGQINLVFNNAGVSVSDKADRMSLEDFHWLMNINFWGVVYGTRAFLPYLQDAKTAHLINTSSIFGTVAVASQSAYNASKFAVRGYTYALRQELADSHIKVTLVQPGGVKTNIVNASRFIPTDNQSLSREEASKKFDAIAGLTAPEAAQIILKGVRKNKARILVGRDAVILSLLERLLPVAHQKLVGKILDFTEG